MKELQRITLKKIMRQLIVLGLITVAAFGVIVYAMVMKWTSTPVTLSELDYSTDLTGVYVKDNIYGIYDYYCETTSDSRVVSREYILDAGDAHYIGLLAGGTDRKKADALMEASWDYLDGKDDGSSLSDKQYEISGVIKKMPSDSLKFYKEYLEWDNMSAQEQEAFLPYYIVLDETGGIPYNFLIIALIVGSVCLLLGVIILIRYGSGGYQKAVKNYLATCPNREMTSEKIDFFIKNTEPYHGVRINSEFICGNNGNRTIFGDLSKLIWAYEHVTTHRTNFVVTGKTYELILGFMDGKKQNLAVKSEQDAIDIMKVLNDRCPHIILGYTDELQRAFSKDMNSFLQIKYQPTMAQSASGQDFSNSTYQQ